MDRPIQIWGLLLLAILGGAADWVQGQAVPAPQTAAPTGEYHSALLKLEKAWENGTDVSVFLSFREGKGAAVWYVSGQRKDAHHLWTDANTLRLGNGKLSGEVQGRMVKQWAPIAEVGNYGLQLTAMIENGKITGSYAASFGSARVSGKLSGTLTAEAQLRKENALPPGKNWPEYYGIHHGSRSPDTATPLIENLHQARPLWKAEEPLPCMWGKGPEDRYPHRACVTGPSGGASSPVLADNRVFVYFYRPSGMPGAAPIPFAQAAPKLKTEEAIVEFAKKHSSSPLAHRAMIDWYRPFADDIVAAFDAATGQTLWRTELKDRSGNHQAHKWRGMNPTPVVADGRLFVQGYGGRLYALDSASGKLIWEHGAVATRTLGGGKVPGGVGPVVSGDVVMIATAGTTLGVNAKSGREFWKAPGRYPLLWQAGEGQRVLLFAVDKLDCLDPATGKRLWSAPVTVFSGMSGQVTGSMALVAGDILVGCAPAKDPKAKPTGGFPCAWKLSATGATKLWEGEFLANDENMPVTLDKDRVYVQGREEIRAYALATGKLLATIRGKEAFPGLHGPGSNPWLGVVGDRLLLNPEGQHGGQNFMLLDRDLKPLSAWKPPHPHDSAYACMAVASPVVDGRVFIRGHDGLYCYDLRRPVK